MSRTVAVWLDAHCSSGDRGVFYGVAARAIQDGGGEIFQISSGRELVALAPRIHSGELIDHLVIAGHGGSTWLLDDEHGVTTGRVRHDDQVTVDDLIDAWSPALAQEPLLSLAACMCSRSPRWYLRWRWAEAVGSDWGRRAYLPGGQASISARIRDQLWWHGHYAEVRGKRGSGHASGCALLARHRGEAGLACQSLFGLVFPGVEPTGPVRRRWVRLVTGELAARWLLGDDSVVEEIRERWAREQIRERWAREQGGGARTRPGSARGAA